MQRLLNLIFFLLVLPGWPGLLWAQATTPTVQTEAAELLISGKIVCASKRTVTMPWRGIITELQSQVGQPVAMGAVLARYRLQPEAQAEVRRRLFPEAVRELELTQSKLAAKARELADQRAGLATLAQQRLASSQSLEQVDRESRLVAREQAVVAERLAWAKKTYQDDLAVLRQQLGQEVNPRQRPTSGQLSAPLAGLLIWMHPDMRLGAELKAGEPVFIVGVMDPMIIQAQVHELEAMRLQVGDQADMEVVSLPGRRFTARISRVSWSSLAPKPDQPSFFEVEFTVANPELLFKDGLKVRLRVPPRGRS